MSALADRRIVVTRADSQADELCERLRALGAIPVRLPTIEVFAAERNALLDGALFALHEWDWVVFTSANGVRFTFERSNALGIGPEAWRALCVAAIGPATTAALVEQGVRPAAMPEEYLGERIADAFGEVRGRRFLLLRADIAGQILPQRLREKGAYVEDVSAYRTRERTQDPEAAALLAQGAHAITFTSPSTVRGFLNIAGAWQKSAAIVTIGPVTSAAAREHGLHVDAQAAEHTIDGLLAALESYFEQAAEREVSR